MSNAPDGVDACWRHIGVWGSERPRCAELERVIHCQNCDVFTAVARRVFDSRAPQLDLAAAQTAPDDSGHASRGSESAVIFRLGPYWLALPTVVIHVVAERSPVHSLPQRRDSILRGLVTIHGEIYTCVSLSVALGLKRQRNSRDNVAKGIFERFVVAVWEQTRFAFRVSEIRGIHRYDLDQLQAPVDGVPDAVSLNAGGALEAELDNGQRVTCNCLDPQRLFPFLVDAVS